MGILLFMTSFIWNNFMVVCSRSICHIGILWRNELHSLETVQAWGILLVPIETSCKHTCITSLASFGIEENETWYQVHNSGLLKIFLSVRLNRCILFFPFYCTRDKSTYSPFQNPKLVRCVIQRGLIVMWLSMTAVMEVLSCSKSAHARNVESVSSCSSTYHISYAVKTLFDTSVRSTSNWM